MFIFVILVVFFISLQYANSIVLFLLFFQASERHRFDDLHCADSQPDFKLLLAIFIVGEYPKATTAKNIYIYRCLETSMFF